MKKNKGTKRALLGSVIVMLLCLAMLIGSTFAWFTDSAATDVNTIQAGNLDLLVQYRKDDGTWADVDETTELFKATEADGTDNLWEPGHTEVVYLKVSNEGTLALKYRLGVNSVSEVTGKNADNETVKLSEHLVFGQTVLESTDGNITPFGGRDEAQAAVNDGSFTLNTYTADTVLYPKDAGADKISEQYIALVVYMPTYVGNEANYRDPANKGVAAIPTITLGVALDATQTPYESDSFDEHYDDNAKYPEPVGTSAEFKEAITEGKDVILTKSFNLTKFTITEDTIIDLNGYTLTGSSTRNDNALIVQDAAVTVKNGTIVAPAVRTSGASALYVTGDSNVTVENCELKTNSNQSYAVVTNGAESLNSTITIRNSTISAPNVSGKKGYAAYIPAGNVSLINCDVTGHVFISGGNVTIDGGAYTATGYNNQSQIFNVNDTIEYAKKITGDGAYNMGDCILIADRRAGYKLESLTIRNVTFSSQISAGTAYAIKYVDLGQDSTVNRVNYVIENNKFNNKIDGSDPTMFIDIDGNPIS